MLYVYSGNRTEGSQKVHRDENVNEVPKGMESHSGSFCSHFTLLFG